MASIPMVTFAQGPLQLLAALSVLDFLDSTADSGCQEILALGGFCIRESSAQYDHTVQCCTEISRVRPHAKVCLLDDSFETVYAQGNATLDQVSQSVRAGLSLADTNRVLVARNWQPLNDCMLALARDGERYCYGDGLGWLDLDSQFWIQRTADQPYGARISKAFLTMPVEMCPGAFSAPEEIVQIPTTHFLKVVHALSGVLPVYDGLSQRIDPENRGIVLLPLSNLVESGRTASLADELQLYLESVLPFTGPEEMILVRDHPRASHNQAKLLTDLLLRQGRRAVFLDDLQSIPVEILAMQLKIKRIVSPVSASSIYLGLIHKTPSVVGVSRATLARLVNPKFVEYMLQKQTIVLYGTVQAHTRAFSPLSYEFIKTQSQQLPFTEPVYVD